jgi:alkylation response protein AidB-like acyl-CoA dehydrogenase
MANISDVITVYAKLLPRRSRRQIQGFLIPKGSQGLRIGRLEDKTGATAIASCEVCLEDCFVPDAAVMGGRYAAMATLVAMDSAMRVKTGAVQLLGGYGFLRDYRSRIACVRPSSARLSTATSEIQNIVIARSYVGKSARPKARTGRYV